MAEDRQDNSPLFREEVQAVQRTNWLGTVLLTPRLSHRLFTVFSGAAAAAILALLIFGDYTRTARIGGWLVPEAGVVQVFAPRPAVVVRLHVSEGQTVRQGQPLLSLSQELHSASMGATQSAIGKRLVDRASSLREEQAQQVLLLKQQQQSLMQRHSALRDEHAKFDEELQLLESRTDIARRAVELQQRLLNDGFISEPSFRQAKSELLELKARSRALERERSAILRERLVVEGELRDLPLRTERELGLIARTLAQLEQDQAESEALRELIVTAPQDGTVTAIHAVQGGQAQTGSPMLSILPSDARLQAHLYGASRSIGFLSEGQRVQLRYEAYPYQRFGHHDGVLTSVSRTAVAPGDLPAHLAALTATKGSNGPAVAEPVYRVTVALPAQHIDAHGRLLPLAAGMVLEADVRLESRRLYEWVLNPLLTLTGKWEG